MFGNGINTDQIHTTAASGSNPVLFNGFQSEMFKMLRTSVRPEDEYLQQNLLRVQN
jgi:hypothetical protein